MFSSFDFTTDDAVELRAVLKPVVEKFHGNAENYYSNFYGLLQESLLPKKFGGDIIGNDILMCLPTKKVHYDNLTIKHDSVKLSERVLKSLQCIIGYVVHKLYSKFKFSKNKNCAYSKQCVSILLCCKIGSDDTQTLINAKDRGGLWRVNETVQNIFIKCEKIFRCFTSEFRLVFKYSELVQEMQANSIIISNYDSLCYSLEPKVNKELSLNLLASILELFVKVRMFSYARDIKEKNKTKQRTKKRKLVL